MVHGQKGHARGVLQHTLGAAMRHCQVASMRMADWQVMNSVSRYWSLVPDVLYRNRICEAPRQPAQCSGTCLAPRYLLLLHRDLNIITSHFRDCLYRLLVVGTCRCMCSNHAWAAAADATDSIVHSTPEHSMQLTTPLKRICASSAAVL